MKRSQLAVILLALATAGTGGVTAGDAGVDDRPARDRRPPKLEISVEPAVLSSPNDRLRAVQITGEVSDEDAVEDLYLAAVESSEPGESGDVAGARIGSFDDEVLLRAQRSPSGEGRTYRITFVAVDADGNETRASATVVVPDRG